MSDLTAKFTALEEQLAAQAAIIQGYTDGLEELVGFINEQLDTINLNDAANTKALLAAITAQDPCACTGSPTLRVPPVGTVPIGVSSDQCKRIQAFLHTMQEVFTTLDFASAFTVGLNFSLIVNSFNEVVTSIESGSDLPVISYSEAVQLVGDMVNYIAGNLLIGGDLSTYFAGVLLDLRSGMALGTSADSMQGLYNGVIDASSMPGYVKSVIKDAAYHALYSYYFDPGTSPALGGFDGSACGGALTDITECTEFQATEQTISGVLYYIVSLPPSYGPFPPAIEGDYFGWSFLITGDESSKMSVYYWDLSDSIQLEVEQFVPDEPAAHVMTHHSHAIIIQSDDAGDRAPFGVIICPPE